MFNMIKKVFVLVFMLLISKFIFSQGYDKIYSSEIDAQKQIVEALERAKSENKNVLIQIGNNNCPWCIKIHEFYTEDAELDSIINQNYVLIFVNCSKENRNLEVMHDLGIPQRFGFPVFVVLDENGERLHTQDTLYLEEEKSYNKDFLKRFLQAWSPLALSEDKNK